MKILLGDFERLCKQHKKFNLVSYAGTEETSSVVVKHEYCSVETHFSPDEIILKDGKNKLYIRNIIEIQLDDRETLLGKSVMVKTDGVLEVIIFLR